MTSSNMGYFFYLKNNTPTSSTLENNYQQFVTWLTGVEMALTPFPEPLQKHYEQESLTLFWDSQLELLPLLQALQGLSHTPIAIDQGTAIYDPARQYYYSQVPTRLPALLQVGQHYEEKIVLGEAASSSLPKEQLQYLTRSYWAGTSTALEVYAWRGTTQKTTYW